MQLIFRETRTESNKVVTDCYGDIISENNLILIEKKGVLNSSFSLYRVLAHNKAIPEDKTSGDKPLDLTFINTSHLRKLYDDK